MFGIVTGRMWGKERKGKEMGRKKILDCEEIAKERNQRKCL